MSDPSRWKRISVTSVLLVTTSCQWRCIYAGFFQVTYCHFCNIATIRKCLTTATIPSFMTVIYCNYDFHANCLWFKRIS